MDIYSFFIFCVVLWVVGKLCIYINLPSIVGEIVVGLILGPHFLHFAPYTDVLKMIGECGLILLVIEAGIEVDVETLKLIGGRGVCVAVFGSMVPLGLGYALSQALGFDVTTSLAMGACLAPTSVGIAINVLKRGKVLNTPVGQLVIAAAVLDDIISLILLSFIQALKDPTIWGMGKPLVVSFGFLFLFGFFALVVMPRILPPFLKMFEESHQEYALLSLLFTFALALIPGTHYTGSSYLLGAFLAGLCFCTDHHAHCAWNRQMKRLMAWLLRLFFSCTIGFEVPIMDVWTFDIMRNTFMFFVCIIGKLATGIFAPAPWRMIDAGKVGFAMSAWGEFAFILATSSRDDHIITEEQFSSVTMAVLLSVIFGPIFLTATINIDHKSKSGKMEGIGHAGGDEFMIPVLPEELEKSEKSSYYRIVTESLGFWGFYTTLERTVGELGLDVLDYRTGRKRREGHSLVQVSMYVRDDQSGDTESRRLEISNVLHRILNDVDAKVCVQDYIPKFSKIDKTALKRDESALYLSPGFRTSCKVHHTATSGEASKKMLKCGVNALLVVDRCEQVLGLVTQSDVMRKFIRAENGNATEVVVNTFMSLAKELVTAPESASKLDMLHLMATHDVKHIVVTHVESGEVMSLIECKELLSAITTNTSAKKLQRRLSSSFKDFDLKEALDDSQSRHVRLKSLHLAQNSIQWVDQTSEHGMVRMTSHV
jgi:Kef-type K+ transport system membrane component KefB